MIRLLKGWSLTIIFCCAVSAQSHKADPSVQVAALSDQRAQLAKQWLQSDEPQQIAWGAAIARQDALTDLNSLLIAQLTGYNASQSLDGSYVAPADRDRHDAMLVVLDALLVNHANLAVEIAIRLQGEFPVQSLILLVRSSDNERNRALLNVFKTNTQIDTEWLTAGNILVASPRETPGFAAAVLSKFTQRLSVTVVDGNRGLGAGEGIGSCGCGGISFKSGWPSVGLYTLSHGHSQYLVDHTVLADGTEPVFYQRSESRSYMGSGGCSDSVDRDLQRSHYLNQMMGALGSNIHLSATSYDSITWTNPDSYRRELLAAIVRHRSQLFQTITALRGNDSITSEEAATLQPHLEVLIWDARQNQNPPLPQVMQSDQNTRFVAQFSPPQR